MNKKVNIIGISGIGGAGKSTLTQALGDALNATMIYWDDFDSISIEPDDFIQWYHAGRDYSAWQYDALAEVLKQLKMGNAVLCPATQKTLVPTPYIIFDAPLGRKHTATGQYIDYAIFLNTPLDIAMARRILRDFRDQPVRNSSELFEELEFYLNSSRPLYAMAYEDNDYYDLIMDGSLSKEVQLKQALQMILTEATDK
jgi:uridine kinase